MITNTLLKMTWDDGAGIITGHCDLNHHLLKTRAMECCRWISSGRRDGGKCDITLYNYKWSQGKNGTPGAQGTTGQIGGDTETVLPSPQSPFLSPYFNELGRLGSKQGDIAQYTPIRVICANFELELDLRDAQLMSNRMVSLKVMSFRQESKVRCLVPTGLGNENYY